MSNTQALTLSARIAELEWIALNGKAARNTLARLYIEQDKVAEAIEDTQNVIYAGEDADATLSRLTALLDAPTTEEPRPAVEEALTDLLPPVGESEPTPGLQIGEVLVVGEWENASEPDGTSAQAPAPQTASEAAQAERQPPLLADLTAHPASSSREVQARLGWPLSTIANWLTKLVVEGLLTVDQSDYPYRYSVAGQKKKDVQEAPAPAELASEPAPQLSDGRTRMVAWLGEHGPHPAKRVAAALGFYPGPCAVQLNGLVRDGLLMSFPGTSPVVYALPGTPLPVPATETPAPKPETPSRAAALPNDRAHRALLLLDQHGPQTIGGLHGHMDVDFSVTTLQRLLVALEKDGLVEATQTSDHTHQVTLTSAGRVRLAAYASGKIEPALSPKPGKRAPVAEQITSFRPAPDQAALNATMRANAALVLGLLEPGQEYVETDLVKTTGLALSHLRMALGNLQATGQLQRLDKVGTRAMYRLEQLDLPAPNGDTLTPEGERVAMHLAHVTARSASDTAVNIATGLQLARADVDQVLAVLNAQGRLAYTRVGNIVMYTLRDASSEHAAD
jgi:GntR family transcriptional repressor for pyruvate dehydrogenase complex